MTQGHDVGGSGAVLDRGFSLRFGAALMLASACLAPAQGQEPKEEERREIAQDGGISERLTVRETTLHVRVRTPKCAVEELTRDRFRIFFGERELPIVAFEELRFSEPKVRSAASRDSVAEGSSPEEPGRSVLIVLDRLFTQRPYLNETIRALRSNLDRFAPGDRVAVMTLDTQARLIHPFTRDRDVLRAGLDLLEAGIDADAALLRQRVVRLQELVSDDESVDANSSIGLRAALGIGASRNVSFTTLAEPSLFDDRAQGLFQGEENELFALAGVANVSSLAQTIQAANEAFSDALRLVADVPGPRYSMLFSEGVGAFRQILSVEEDNSIFNPRAGASASTLGSYQALSYVLQAHGWTVQAFDVSGVGERSRNFSMANSGPRALQGSQAFSAIPDLALRGGLSDPSGDSLFFLADETGGDFYQQFNGIDGVLRESLDAIRHHYRIVVALEASDEELDRRRTLRVEVVDLPRKARVRHSLTADWAMPPNLRRTDAVESARDQLLSGRTSAQLTLDVAQLGVFLVPHSETTRRAVVVLDADMAALTRHLEPARGEARLKVHGLASGLSVEPGRGQDFLDLFEVDAGWSQDSAAPSSRLLVTGDLIVPCSGAVIRLRFAGPAESQGVLREHEIADTCGKPLSWASAVLEGQNDFAFALEQGFSLSDPEQNPFSQGGFTYFPNLRRRVERGAAVTLLAYGPETELRLDRGTGDPSNLALERSSELSEKARLETFLVDAESGVYELVSGDGPSSGALVRVLDFGSSKGTQDGSCTAPSG
ncbi:MAG: VWA domain-containing protein [Acidobacteriota bacterium]